VRSVRFAVAWLATFVAVSPAAAHLALRYPPSRYGDNVLKTAPCGVVGGLRSIHVTTLEPGATIEVVWDEYVDHPGHFRISFDAAGDGDFMDPPCLSGCNSRTPEIASYSNETVLLDHIADTPFGGEGRAKVTLPDIECDNCTLQAIQVMYDKPPYTLPGDDIYYQCADLVLRRSAPTPTASPTASGSPSPTASPTRTPRPTPIPTATSTARPSPTIAVAPPCVGDCEQAGVVTLDDVLAGIGAALAGTGVDPCLGSFGEDGGAVTVEDLVAAVNGASHGCSPPS